MSKPKPQFSTGKDRQAGRSHHLKPEGFYVVDGQIHRVKAQVVSATQEPVTLCDYKRNPHSSRPPCSRLAGHSGPHSYDGRLRGR